jgi:hypothetical protein
MDYKRVGLIDYLGGDHQRALLIVLTGVVHIALKRAFLR